MILKIDVGQEAFFYLLIYLILIEIVNRVSVIDIYRNLFLTKKKFKKSKKITTLK